MASTRNIGLDYLRSLAIVVVLINHALIGFFYTTSVVAMEGFLVSFTVSAVIAIEWLFVLSGFLIGAMMIRSFDRNQGWLKSARDFWLRRWFRTIPNYYLFFLVNFLLAIYGVTTDGYIFSPLWFSQNLAWEEVNRKFFGEAWSLALDEWFYLAMPIIVGILSFSRISKEAIFICAATILIVFPTIGRLLQPVPTDFFQWDEQIRRITIYHLDATGWGVLAAALSKWFPQWWRSRVNEKALVGIFCMATGLFFVISLVHPKFMNYLSFSFGNAFSITLMSVGTLLILPWLTRIKFSWTPVMWITGKLSEYSYSIYLSHFPLIFLFKHFLEIDSTSSGIFLFFVVASWFLLVVFLSGVVFTFFEKPIADLRESFTKRVDASPF